MFRLTPCHRRWSRSRTSAVLALATGVVAASLLSAAPANANPTVPDGTAPDLADSTRVETSSCQSPHALPLPTSVATTLAPGNENSNCVSSGGSEQSGASPDTDDWAELRQQYGLIGCKEVPGFNDRCPTMVSEPAKATPNKGSLMQTKFAQSPDGELIFGAGREEISQGDPSEQTVITAYKTDDGAIAWHKPLAEVALGANNAPMGVTVSEDGRQLYVTGRTFHTLGLADDGWVAALDTTNGNVLWSQSMIQLLGAEAVSAAGPVAAAWPFGVAVSADSQQVFVSAAVNHTTGGAFFAVNGFTEATADNTRAWHFSLDSTSGSLNWRTNANKGPASITEMGSDQLKVSPNGSLLYSQVTLMSPSWSAAGIATIALNTTTGNVVWEHAHMLTGASFQFPPAGVMLTPDGSQVLSIGTRSAENNAGSFVILAFDATSGRSLWSREYSATQASGCERAQLIAASPGHIAALSPSGNMLYLVGLSRGGPNPASCFFWGGGAAVFAINTASGDLQWTAFHPSNNRELYVCGYARCGIAVAPGPGGLDAGAQVFILVDPIAPPDTFYASTISHDAATGEQLWRARYLDTSNDGGSWTDAIAGGFVSPDGTRLYVPNYEKSTTRGWYDGGEHGVVTQILGYDITREAP